MGFFKRSKHASYSMLETFNWYVPGIGGMLAIIGIFIGGSILGSLITLGLVQLNLGLKLEHLQLIAYPISFVPAMIYARAVSYRNMYFEDGYAVDSKTLGNMKMWLACILSILAALALSFIMDGVNNLLPPMPDVWKQALEALAGGNVFISFTCVCLFAPFFEEWLLRGIILRGLLNSKREGGRRGYHPAIAITLSSFVFAVIHLNIWQGLPAFVLGCLFGYVYYKTGSLKLTMLMHFANNFLSFITTQITGSEVESWNQVIPAPMYYAIGAACLAILLLTILRFRKIETSPQGGCWLIPAAEPQA